MADREIALAALTDAPLIDRTVAPAAIVAVDQPGGVADSAAPALAVIGDGEAERVVLVDRYGWLVDNGNGGRWHMSARRGDVVRVSDAEAERGESLGALAAVSPPDEPVTTEVEITAADTAPTIADEPVKTKKGKR